MSERASCLGGRVVCIPYQSFIGRNGLELIDYGITWERYHQNGEVKKSSLDHSLTNIPAQVGNHKKEYVTFSDHSAIFVDLEVDMKKMKKIKWVARDMRKLRANPQKLIQELYKID